MAYEKHILTGGPDELINLLRDYAVSCGWTILVESDDLAVDSSGMIDGRRLVINSPSGKTYASFRSANGRKIFKTQNTGSGLGLVCAAGFEEFPSTGYWYDQPGVTKATNQEVIGVGIPLQPAPVSQTVYFNHISDPSELILISVEIADKTYQHMAVGEVQKVGSWTGGTIYSASRNSASMFTDAFTPEKIENTSNHLFGLSNSASTFLRADIDGAPMRVPEILWAAGGPNTGGVNAGYTGKTLALPIMNVNCLTAAWLPKVPHYGYLQSQNATDTGRNVNTLNCISVNLPLAVYVQRDPDTLMNFAQCGYVPGVYFISTRNIAPSQIYNVNYPASDITYQVFPNVKRGGVFGYDGIAIQQ